MAEKFNREEFEKKIDSCGEAQEVWRLNDFIFSEALDFICTLKISEKNKEQLQDYLVANRHAVRKS